VCGAVDGWFVKRESAKHKSRPELLAPGFCLALLKLTVLFFSRQYPLIAFYTSIHTSPNNVPTSPVSTTLFGPPEAMRSFLRLNKEHKTEKAGNSNNNNGKVEWKYGLFDAVHDDGEEAIVE
jgi:hypothetical protein